MSFDLVQLGRLQRVGGATLAKYEQLFREAAGAQYDSPAVRALERFQHDFAENPEAVKRIVEAQVKPANTRARA